uniref:Fibroblast growth factor receptor substrate 3 n=1 Tax=Cacopsylla melanoneura TaxID=428564 RepID=A0A8D8STB5_9HEMI
MKFSIFTECWKMGCVESREDLTLPPNLFQITSPVYKHDDNGIIDLSLDNNMRISGERFVEITEIEMVIHQGNLQRSLITQAYPLRILRRYGIDEVEGSTVFRFEAGRKCSTGQGFYTFKCPEAGRLFNYLQNHIQTRYNPNDDTISHRSHDGNNSSTVHSTLRSNRTSRLNSNVSNGALSPTLPLSPPGNFYVNGNALQNELDNMRADHDKLLNNNHIANMYVNLDFGVNSPLSPTFSTTDGDNIFPPADNNNEDEPSHNYANINPDYNDTVLPPSTSTTGGKSHHHGLPPLNLKSIPPVNYLVLELGNPSPTPTSPLVPPESPNKPTGGYATIDFDKTSALSHAVSRSNSEDINECSRKTRHNSSISDSFSFVKSGSDS